jgi:hypothetical protein
MLNIFDSRERITPVEEVQGMVNRDNKIYRAISNLDTMVNTLGLKVNVAVPTPEEAVSYQQPAEIAQSSTHDMANVLITGTTKSPAEDLALQRVYEIHDDMGRHA